MRFAAPSPHALGRLSRSSDIRLSQWNLGEQVGALPWSALDLEAAVQMADPLLHRAQTEMARKEAQRIKPDPIVTYLQDDRVGSPAKDQVHLARTGMLDRVMHGLLRDAVEFLFDREREARLLAECMGSQPRDPGCFPTS